MKKTHPWSSLGSVCMLACCVHACGYRRSCFPAETAPRAERRPTTAFASTNLSHTHTVSQWHNTTSALAASASHGQEDQEEHILIQASIPQLPPIVCAPPTPGVFIHRLLFSLLFFLKTSTRIIFLCCIFFILSRWFHVLITFCEEKKRARDAEHHHHHIYIKLEIWWVWFHELHFLCRSTDLRIRFYL